MTEVNGPIISSGRIDRSIEAPLKPSRVWTPSLTMKESVNRTTLQWAAVRRNCVAMMLAPQSHLVSVRFCADLKNKKGGRKPRERKEF